MQIKDYERKGKGSKRLLLENALQITLPMSPFLRLPQELEGNLARMRGTPLTPFPPTIKALLKVERYSHPASPALNTHFLLEKQRERNLPALSLGPQGS